MILARVVEQNPAHVRVQVFAGGDREHLALAGTLTFDRGEWLREVEVRFGAAGFMPEETEDD